MKSITAVYYELTIIPCHADKKNDYTASPVSLLRELWKDFFIIIIYPVTIAYEQSQVTRTRFEIQSIIPLSRWRALITRGEDRSK